MRCFVTFLIFLFSTAVLGQDSLPELERSLKGRTGKARITALNKLSTAYSTRNMEKARSLANQAFELATAIEDIRGQVQSVFNTGKIYAENNENIRALDYFKKGLALATEGNELYLIADGHLRVAESCLQGNRLRESIAHADTALKIATGNHYKQLSAQGYQLLGANYDKLSLYKNSLTYYFQSLRIHEALEDSHGMATDFNSIGKVYQHTEDFDDALRYFTRAMEINTIRKDTLGIVFNVHNIGVIYQKKQYFEQALQHYRQALSMAKKLRHKGEEAILTGNIGSTYMQQGKLEAGLEYLLQALEIKKSIQSHRSILHTLNDISHIKLLLDAPEEAKNYAGQVIRLAREYEEGNQLRYGYLNLSRSYEKLGDFEKAHAALVSHNAVKDSLFGLEKARHINELEIQYETDKKEQAILSLQQEKEIANFRKKVYFLIALVVLLVLGGLYLNQRLKNKRNRALLEKEKEVDRLKSSFFANISHEFRTPLTLILGPIETLLAASSDTGQRHQLRIMKKSATRLLRLINQILDLSKLESGHVALQARQANIIPVIKGVAGSFRSLADSREIALTVEAEETDLQLYFDTAQIETILINLISNAFKFSSRGGRITVKARTVPEEKSGHGKLEIRVVDNGGGIPPDQVKHIFDRFYQAGHAKAAHYGGTGIGLALTRELVELHGGTITIQSEQGRGTQACVHLPLGRDHLNDSQIVPAENRPGPSLPPGPLFTTKNEASEKNAPDTAGKKPLVLIIEDNADVRQYINMIASGEYAIIEAVNGQQGVDQAIKHTPDLVISDVMMPVMDGYEVCRHLKQDEKTSHIPVILLTAKASVKSRIEGLETEADIYLSKPFVPAELLLCIRNLIGSRKKLRQRYNKQVVLQPGDIAINSVDELFLTRLIKVVETRFTDEAFNVDALGKAMNMSRSQIHRKLQALTGESSSQFIRSYRLQRAMQLLKNNHASISEIAFKVGFGSPSYFNKCFLKQYGCTPSSVINKKKAGVPEDSGTE